MQWTRAAAAIGVVLGALMLAAGGCEPQLPQVTQPTPDAGATVSDETEVATQIPTQPVAEPAITPAPGLPASPVPSASASVVPKPSRVAASQSPTAVQQSAALIAVSMAKDNRVAEIDPVTGKTSRVVDLSEPAGRMTLSPDGHTAWVFKPQDAGSTIAMLDVTTGDRREDLKFHEDDVPVAVAFSTDGTRAFVAVGGSVVFATASGKEFGRVSVGPPGTGVQIPRRVSSLAVNPGPSGDVVYAADHASGVVWALDGGSGALLNEIDVGGGPVSVVADSTRARDYVLSDTVNQLVAVDTSTMRISNRLDLPSTPTAAAIGPDGTVYVTGGDPGGELWVVTPGATELRARVPIGGTPVSIAPSIDGGLLFVADAASKTLNIVSADTVQVLRTISLASEPVTVLATRPSSGGPPEAADAKPGLAPSLIASPTALPEGALPPDKLPAGAVAEPFVTGAAMPSALGFAPDGRLFYAERQTGKIRVVQNGVVLADPFYQFLVAGQADTGLLGLTLDPDFANNHRLYALYTAPKTGLGEIVRLTDVDSRGTDLRPVLQDLPAVGTQHSATLRFGGDGELYVAVSDDDKGTNAQDLSTLAGKILRVNPDGSIPTDNPFAGQQGKQEAIWAYGLHNAYSFAFHPLGHALLAVDSSEGDHDALDVIVRGGNYGWPATPDKSKTGVIAPIAVIKPSIQPTGSTFYTGDQLAGWNNDWFYCDMGLKELRRVHLAAVSFDRVVSDEVVKQGCSYDVATGTDGALYYSDAQGIYRIRMQAANVLPAPGFSAGG